MKAIILAAGKGERLGKITKRIPKPMVKFNGKPILEYNVELCRKSGITDIYINVHHLSDVIIDYFGDGKRYGLRINYSHENELLGTSGAVNRIAHLSPDFLNEPFFVIYGDNYSQYNLNSDKYNVTCAIGVIGFHYREDTSTSGVAEFDPSFRITSFIEKPKQDETLSHWVNAGIYYLSPKIVNFISDGISDFASDIFPMLLQKNIPIYGVCEKTDVKAFDTLEMLEKNLK
jgi:NDP-sugar pyrophosphorylase family protein